MAEHQHLGEIAVGKELVATFEKNTKPSRRGFTVRARRCNGRRAPKLLVSRDHRITPGQPVKVRVTHIAKPAAKVNGYIEVEFVASAPHPVCSEDFYVDPMLERKVRALLQRGHNLVMIGPAGSGKGTLAQRVVRSMGLELVFFNCSVVYEPTDFLAQIQLRATESGGHETVWVKTPILRALEKAVDDPAYRCAIFLDEANRSARGSVALNGLMPALDSTRLLYNPITGEHIGIPDSVLWIAAINSGSQYSGTTQLDVAHLDRFSPVAVTYLPAREEARVLSHKFPKVEKDVIERLVKAANAVRHDRNLRLELSVRATEEVCSLLSHDEFVREQSASLPELMKTSFGCRFQGSIDDGSTDAGLAWSVVTRALEL